MVPGGLAVFKATLSPEKIYEHISSWEGTHSVHVSVVNKDGLHQLATSRRRTALEASSIVPPERSLGGTGHAIVEQTPLTYAYSWIRMADWAVVVQPAPVESPGFLFTWGWRILGIGAAMMLLGLAIITVSAGRLVELEKESDQAKALLAERVKELSCLYGIADLVEKPSISLEEILRGTVKLLQDAWRYPEITCARIQVWEQEYTTVDWEETVWKQGADIIVQGEKIGTVEVCYKEEKPRRDEGPFLKEERNLLDAVAERLGRIIAHRLSDERQSLLATAVENAAESILVTDLEGKIEYVNPAFEKVTGYRREEVVGRNPRILKSGKQDRAFYEELWQTICEGKTWDGHFINKKKDGSLFEEIGSISAVRDERGHIVRFVAVKRDVTHLVKLESSLRQVQKMEAIGQLAGRVAHPATFSLQPAAGSRAQGLGPQPGTHRDRKDASALDRCRHRAGHRSRLRSRLGL
jgi:PAS domain S-box-containing protein